MYRERRKKKSSFKTIDDEVEFLEMHANKRYYSTHDLKSRVEQAKMILKGNGIKTKLDFIEHPFSREKYDRCYSENAELWECLEAVKHQLGLCRGLLEVYKYCKARPS